MQVAKFAVDKSPSDAGIMDTLSLALTKPALSGADVKYSGNSSTVKPTMKAWAVWLIVCPAAKPGCDTDISSVCFVDIKCTLVV